MREGKGRWGRGHAEHNGRTLSKVIDVNEDLAGNPSNVREYNVEGTLRPFGDRSECAETVTDNPNPIHKMYFLLAHTITHRCYSSMPISTRRYIHTSSISHTVAQSQHTVTHTPYLSYLILMVSYRILYCILSILTPPPHPT